MHDDEVLGRAYDARLMQRIWAAARPHRGLIGLSLAFDPALDPRLTDPKWKIPEDSEGVRAPRWFAQALAPFWTMYNTRQAHAFIHEFRVA